METETLHGEDDTEILEVRYEGGSTQFKIVSDNELTSLGNTRSPEIPDEVVEELNERGYSIIS